MKKFQSGFTCLNCGVLFCDRVRSDRERKFCTKSCSSKYAWINHEEKFLIASKNKRSPIFKDVEFSCEYCGGKQKRRSSKHRWCDLCVRPESLKQDRNLLIKYGISWREYETMLKKQDYKCLICFQKPKIYNVDHCHKTGKIRGILCSRCNGVLEFIEDSKRLKKALNYLGSV